MFVGSCMSHTCAPYLFFYFVIELPHGMLTPLKNFSERNSATIMSDLLTAHNPVVMTTPLSTVLLQLVVFEFYGAEIISTCLNVQIWRCVGTTQLQILI